MIVLALQPLRLGHSRLSGTPAIRINAPFLRNLGRV
jgi:hypothetical protein